MKATVNGVLQELPAEATVGALLDLLGSPRAGIAVACNDQVVPRSRFDTDLLREGDRLEIITAVAGG
ncbi:MAG TPA: sulfur carrier protein ThiS [Candidatus Cybelea sp.]|nr:sulfur carrier protein ThiS [Candidatus Cybelea sp.]